MIVPITISILCLLAIIAAMQTIQTSHLSHWYLMARISLAGLWVFSGITSLFFAPDHGYQLLAETGLDRHSSSIIITLASSLDIALGIWLLSRWQRRRCYQSQIILIISYSLLLMLISPEFWLHPFGPLTKNLPLLALLGILYYSDNRA